jgi:metal-responsive CopG/Arc/MetJ family transcriptional regulator
MARSSVQMTVSLPPALYKLAMRVAKEDFRSKSELVREALRMYVSRNRMVHQARKQLSQNLRGKGIGTLEDIERFVNEGRTSNK